MPISKYFKGHGKEVKKKMEKKHGKKEGKKMFFATANKKGLKAGPSDKMKKKHNLD